MNPRIAVAIGAILGASLRFLIVSATSIDQVWTTLIVNLVGCFALGLVLVHGERYLISLPRLQPVWRPFLATGLLGGFTTTSAFAVQSMNLLQKGEAINFLILFFFSVVGGLVVFQIAQSIAIRGMNK